MSDAEERSVWLGSQVLTYRVFYYNSNKNTKYHLTTLYLEMNSSNL